MNVVFLQYTGGNAIDHFIDVAIFKDQLTFKAAHRAHFTCEVFRFGTAHVEVLEVDIDTKVLETQGHIRPASVILFKVKRHTA